MVRAGEDDAEEAREEMSSRKAMSPVKRLRGLAGDQASLLADPKTPLG